MSQDIVNPNIWTTDPFILGYLDSSLNEWNPLHCEGFSWPALYIYKRYEIFATKITALVLNSIDYKGIHVNRHSADRGQKVIWCAEVVRCCVCLNVI